MIRIKEMTRSDCQVFSKSAEVENDQYKTP